MDETVGTRLVRSRRVQSAVLSVAPTNNHVSSSNSFLILSYPPNKTTLFFPSEDIECPVLLDGAEFAGLDTGTKYQTAVTGSALLVVVAPSSSTQV